jgi:hypothetical protein
MKPIGEIKDNGKEGNILRNTFSATKQKSALNISPFRKITVDDAEIDKSEIYEDSFEKANIF